VEGIDEGNRKRTKDTSRTRWKAEGEEDLRMMGIISWKKKREK
jgi:hypothetical protein